MSTTVCPPTPVPAWSLVSASMRAVPRWSAPPEWLAPGERARAARIRSRPARDAWLTARLAAKRLIAPRLADFSAGQFAAIEIQSRDAAGRGSRPRVFHAGREVAVALSIAHDQTRVIVAVGPAGRPLGVDLTPAAAFAEASSRWWLTASERNDAAVLEPAAAVGHAARLWSVKEAVYKAVLADEPFRPLAIEVRFKAGRLVSCRASGRGVPAAGIRSWPVAGHWLALVQAPADGGEAEG